MWRTPENGGTPAGRGRPPAETARRLCAGCRDQLEKDLVELAELYEMCAFAVELSDQTRSSHPVVAVQSEVSRVLASWCDAVAGERGVAAPEERDVRRVVAPGEPGVGRVVAEEPGVRRAVAPGEPGGRRVAADEPDVRRLVAFLVAHLDWLAGHPAAAGFAAVLDELASAVREALRPPAQYRSLLPRNEK